MKPELKELVDISRFYGVNKDYVIAGGGNTSYKDDKYLWVKASGTTLGTVHVDTRAVAEALLPMLPSMMQAMGPAAPEMDTSNLPSFIPVSAWNEFFNKFISTFSNKLRSPVNSKSFGLTIISKDNTTDLPFGFYTR